MEIDESQFMTFGERNSSFLPSTDQPNEDYALRSQLKLLFGLNDDNTIQALAFSKYKNSIKTLHTEINQFIQHRIIKDPTFFNNKSVSKQLSIYYSDRFFIYPSCKIDGLYYKTKYNLKHNIITIPSSYTIYPTKKQLRICHFNYSFISDYSLSLARQKQEYIARLSVLESNIEMMEAECINKENHHYKLIQQKEVILD